MTHPLRVAIVGAGPAGIYAADLLIKSAADVSIDLFEQMPAPFGLIRYGVAPDHPRIKGIVKSLHNVLDKPEVRLLANITIGRDITVDELRSHYDAVVFSTGAVGDRDLGRRIRGILRRQPPLRTVLGFVRAVRGRGGCWECGS